MPVAAPVTPSGLMIADQSLYFTDREWLGIEIVI
jgi:hypothetical protein